VIISCTIWGSFPVLGIWGSFAGLYSANEFPKYLKILQPGASSTKEYCGFFAQLELLLVVENADGAKVSIDSKC